MANYCNNRLIVVGLKEKPEDFATALEIEIHGRPVPREPDNLFVQVTKDAFEYTTKWEPKIRALVGLSKRREDYVFLFSYRYEEEERTGQAVIQNGYFYEFIERSGYSGLFDDIKYPMVDLFERYVQRLTLAQSAENRLQDAIEIVRGLIRIMDDERFTDSPSTPYSDVRDQEQTEKARAGLATLLDSMATQVRQVDFRGVLLEEEELREGMDRNAQATEDLMKSLRLDHLVPDGQLAVRFAILPFTAAIIQDPHRVILPVIHYANADPGSGDYQKNADRSTPPIMWEIRYVCLRPWQVRQIKSLLVGNQTPCDIDLAMTEVGGTFGNVSSRVSNRAQWTLNPELAQQVEQEAIEMSHAFAAKLGNTPA